MILLNEGLETKKRKCVVVVAQLVFCLFVFVLLGLLGRQTFCLQGMKGCDELSCWKHLPIRALRLSRLCQSLT